MGCRVGFAADNPLYRIRSLRARRACQIFPSPPRSLPLTSPTRNQRPVHRMTWRWYYELVLATGEACQNPTLPTSSPPLKPLHSLPSLVHPPNLPHIASCSAKEANQGSAIVWAQLTDDPFRRISIFANKPSFSGSLTTPAGAPPPTPATTFRFKAQARQGNSEQVFASLSSSAAPPCPLPRAASSPFLPDPLLVRSSPVAGPNGSGTGYRVGVSH